MLYAGNRIGGLADRTTQQVETVIATLEDTSTVLIDAGELTRVHIASAARIPAESIKAFADRLLAAANAGNASAA